STSMYSPKEPFWVYPPYSASGQWVSRPVIQNSHVPHADQSQALPTMSPTLTSCSPGPSSTTSPMPSWPGTNGGSGLNGLSPSKACKSVWQMPDVSTLTRAWLGPGVGRSISLTVTSGPNFSTTAALNVWGSIVDI